MADNDSEDAKKKVYHKSIEHYLENVRNHPTDESREDGEVRVRHAWREMEMARDEWLRSKLKTKENEHV